MKVSFSSPTDLNAGTVVLVVLEGSKLGARGRELDGKLGKALTRALKSSRFEGKINQTLNILAPANSNFDGVLLVGLGKLKGIDEKTVEDVGGGIYSTLSSTGTKRLDVFLEKFDGVDLKNEDFAAHLAFGARLRSYKFDK